jgi:murein DD-endopeptidase MepM/ murein hydrolase activator NlpD
MHGTGTASSLTLVPLDQFCTVVIQGQAHWVGELSVRHTGLQPLMLAGLRASDGAGAVVLQLTQAQLLACAAAPDGRPAASLRMAPGEELRLFIWHPLAASNATVRELSMAYAPPTEPADEKQARSVRLPAPEAPSALRPPLRGGPWAAVYDPAHPFGHRRAAFVRADVRYIPARYAIDWIRVDAAGGVAPSAAAAAAAADYARWHGFGQEVLAVADARVALVRDGMQDVLASRLPPPGWTPAGVAGNHVCLDIGAGRFVFYEHLQSGSIQVRENDRVLAGQVLARVGRSGVNSSGPHLHFHVADRPDVLFAQGRPCSISGLRTLGRYHSMDAAEEGKAWTPQTAPDSGLGQAGFPAPNAVVMFEA